jgi:predicted peroxiredoxin
MWNIAIEMVNVSLCPCIDVSMIVILYLYYPLELLTKKKQKMKKSILFIAILSMMISCVQVGDQKVDMEEETITRVESPRDGVFIHITQGYDDPHRVLMPMKMATMMAQDQDVLVYMDIHAVELLVKDAKDLEMDGFDPFQTYLKQLLDMNVGVYACPSCMAVAGLDPENLMEGVQTANKEAFFHFTKGRIISLDY